MISIKRGNCESVIKCYDSLALGILGKIEYLKFFHYFNGSFEKVERFETREQARRSAEKFRKKYGN